MFRLAVFASGKGSNLRAIDRAIRINELRDVELALIVSNNSNSEALAYAREHHIPGVHLSIVSAGGSEAELATAMLHTLEDHRIDLIALAGYMKKVPTEVIGRYRGRIVNIHPALLPDFGGEGMYGMHVHRAVHRSKKNETGATVHFVDDEYDSGTIVMQERCKVEATDTPEDIGLKVLALEHSLYPKALQLVVNRLKSQATQ